MTIVLVPLDHFSGQRNIAPTPDTTQRDLARLLRETQTQINSNEASGGRQSDFQATAATLAKSVMIAPGDGAINVVQAFAEVTAAAGESMEVDVKINGTTVLTSTVTLDNAAGTDVQEGTLDAAVAFVKGDKITVERTYVAGGGPTPMTGTLVDIGYALE